MDSRTEVDKNGVVQGRQDRVQSAARHRIERMRQTGRPNPTGKEVQSKVVKSGVGDDPGPRDKTKSEQNLKRDGGYGTGTQGLDPSTDPSTDGRRIVTSTKNSLCLRKDEKGPTQSLRTSLFPSPEWVVTGVSPTRSSLLGGRLES